MSNACKLVVVAGAHAGAETTLADGICLVGSDFGCDIILLDAGISPRHLRLRIKEGRISVERLLGSQVTLHGMPADQVMFEVMDKDEIGIGGAVFRLHGVVDPLPQEVPVAPEAIVATEEPALPNDLDDDTPTLEILDASGPGPVQGSQAAIAPEPPPEKRQRHHPVIWGLPLTVVVIGLGAFFGSRALQASAPLRMPQAKLAMPAPEARDELVARVREFLGDDGLNVQRDPAGRIVVSGKTRAMAVKQQLADIRNEFKGTIEIVDRVAYVSDNKAHNTVRLPQRITDIHVGEVRWFQTADGMRNFEGSVLEDGAEVVRINIDGIVFRRDGKLAIFKLTEEERSK